MTSKSQTDREGTPRLHPSTLAWVRAVRRIDRLNWLLATKDFGPDRAKHTAPIHAEIQRLRAMTEISNV